ncbi:ATP-binding protein [Thiomicrospira sp. WB1]|uniref:sensor histidine kinase n=1 Tax=Thiomicrospira sp. WB1 TaxID=1685380 RepID=UPI000747BDDF|nr:ATP-binding protein [Thiomicrospira sp. WB1]KUJ71202.1 histidine kinase [Thiomicrospira sp. WB1]
MKSLWHNPMTFFRQYGLLIAIASVLLMILVMMSQILQNASQFAQTYSLLLFISFSGVLLLLIMLGRTLYRLRRQYLDNVPGTRLTRRLAGLFSLIIGLPLTVMFYFSYTFVQQSIDQWFDVKTENALDHAVELVQVTLNDQTRRSLNATEQLLNQHRTDLLVTPVLTLSKMSQQLGIRELALYQSDGRLVAYSTTSNSRLLPPKPAPRLFQNIRNDRNYAAIETQVGTNNAYQIIRVMIPVQDLANNQTLALQAIFPLPEQISQLASKVRVAANQYQELSYLKGPLKTSFTMILALVWLLGLIVALLFTLQALQNMTRPIRTLAEGTRAVAQGDYSVTIPETGDDEMGQLITSFNEMIQQIAKARHEIKFGHQQTEIQKLYLQAIIKNLSSGVLTLDPHMRLKTINDATNAILETQLFTQQGSTIKDILNTPDRSHLAAFFEEIMPRLRQDNKPWHHQLTLDTPNAQKILLIHGSTLPSLDQKIGGYVLVVEDITQLVQAQLHAAWTDVAQRLAHEIKNPLTPIQLSAERLQFKLARHLNPDEAALLERLTDTIIEQVSTMQSLVQAFTEYANTPELALNELNLNQLIEDVAGMYQETNQRWHLHYSLDPACERVVADGAKLRQLLHNLIKNALEACEDQDEAEIRIETQCKADPAKPVILKICDNGPGIPENARNWIFEPYATDKPKGTGLGLAIVKKIVDEHHGRIQLIDKPAPEQGTCFEITLPGHTHQSVTQTTETL